MGRPLALLVLCSLFALAPVRAQVAYQPEFDVDAVAVRGADGSPRLDLYTDVPNESLKFLARRDGFRATYTVTVNAYRTNAQGRTNALVQTRTWERTVDAPDYAATQKDALRDRAAQALPLPPGNYALEVILEDGASRRAFTREVAVVVPDFARELAADGVAISGLLFAERYDAGTGTLVTSPGATVPSDAEAFTLYYEIYAREARTLRVRYDVDRASPAAERPSWREPDAQPEAPFASTETLEVRAGRNPAALRLPTDRFSAGEFTFRVRLETPDGKTVARAERPFTVRWMGLSDQIQDLDAAISQLRYIAKDRDIKAIREAADPDERFRLFRAFWAKRDPTPATRRNERMEEYYYRVAYANRSYGRFNNSGWNTDRGEVFIRFGEPEMVEQHPFNYGTKPYEVWYYSRIGRRFIFVDDTGFGDYELLIPIWDDRTRM